MASPFLSFAARLPLVPELILAGKAAWDSRLRHPPPTADDGALALWHRHVRRDGIYVVPDFLPAAACERLRAAVDEAMAAFPEAVQRDAKGADARVFFGAPAPAAIVQVAHHPRLARTAELILGRGTINIATLAGRITAVPENLGSGGGWHRDSFTNQFKALIYLSDVDETNGPFQFIRTSHRLAAMMRDRRVAGLGIDQTRIDEGQIARLLGRGPERLVTVTGAAGTLVLADTTGLHRGKPLVSGTRYAATNYYYASRTVTASTYDHFRPILGRHIPYRA